MRPPRPAAHPPGLRVCLHDKWFHRQRLDSIKIPEKRSVAVLAIPLLNMLVAHGYVVLRFGWEHLDQPEYIVSMVRHALRTAGRIK